MIHRRQGRRRRSRFRARTAVGAILLVAVTACTPPNLPAPLAPVPGSTQSVSVGTEVAEPPDELSIGVDGAISGFNPYLVNQWSTAAAAVSELVLPAVFPPGSTGPESAPTALVDKVEVTSLDPFTVTYNLNTSAAWTDGTPIAAEDFTYLWQQMIGQPGVIDAGGYRLISDIESQDAGKTVVVTFAVPFADWRTLFSPLLPARTLKDDFAGFGDSFVDGLPVSGSSYKMDSFDPINGEIVLIRNDKYWGTEPGPTKVTIRIGTDEEMATALDRGDIDLLYLQPDQQVAQGLIRRWGAQNIVTVPLPVTNRIDFGPDGVTADPAVRRALALSVDLNKVGAVWADDRGAGALAVTSMLTLPADGSGAAGGPRPTGTVDRAFAEAGYTRPGLYRQKDGQILTVTIGFPAETPGAVRVAKELQSELGRAGVLADLLGRSAADLRAVGEDSQPVVDLMLATVPRGPSDSAQAAAAFGCLAAPAAEAEEPVTPLCPVTDGTDVNPAMLAALATGKDNGSADGAAALAALDDLLWQRLTELPVSQPRSVVVLGPRLTGLRNSLDAPAMMWGGPLVDVPTWTIGR